MKIFILFCFVSLQSSCCWQNGYKSTRRKVEGASAGVAGKRVTVLGTLLLTVVLTSFVVLYYYTCAIHSILKRYAKKCNFWERTPQLIQQIASQVILAALRPLLHLHRPAMVVWQMLHICWKSTYISIFRALCILYRKQLVYILNLINFWRLHSRNISLNWLNINIRLIIDRQSDDIQ